MKRLTDMGRKKGGWLLVCLICGLRITGLMAQSLPSDNAVQFDVISITATREARTTKEVPQSISVVDEKRIDDVRMCNIKDATGSRISFTPGIPRTFIGYLSYKF